MAHAARLLKVKLESITVKVWVAAGESPRPLPPRPDPAVARGESGKEGRLGLGGHFLEHPEGDLPREGACAGPEWRAGGDHAACWAERHRDGGVAVPPPHA